MSVNYVTIPRSLTELDDAKTLDYLAGNGWMPKSVVRVFPSGKAWQEAMTWAGLSPAIPADDTQPVRAWFSYPSTFSPDGIANLEINLDDAGNPVPWSVHSIAQTAPIAPLAENTVAQGGPPAPGLNMYTVIGNQQFWNQYGDDFGTIPQLRWIAYSNAQAKSVNYGASSKWTQLPLGLQVSGAMSTWPQSFGIRFHPDTLRPCLFSYMDYIANRPKVTTVIMPAGPRKFTDAQLGAITRARVILIADDAALGAQVRADGQ